MRRIPTGVFVAIALALAIGLATAVSPFASPNPDGLEKVADQKAFLDQGKLHSLQEDSPIPDYAFPGSRTSASRPVWPDSWARSACSRSAGGSPGS